MDEKIPFAPVMKWVYDHGPRCTRCGKVTRPYPLHRDGKPYCWECDEKLREGKGKS